MAKGDETRERILEQALSQAGTVGFEGLSIGELAKATGLSKSGLFAHFSSKEDLQLQALASARASFITHVISPALTEPRGEPRIRAMFDRWLRWEEGRASPGGCPFVVASYEYDDRPGPLRELVADVQKDWVDTMQTAIRIAIDEGHLRQGIDTAQVAFELYAAFLSFHLSHRLLRDPEARQRAWTAFEHLLDTYR